MILSQSLSVSNDLSGVGGSGDRGALCVGNHLAALIKLVGAAIVFNFAVNGDGVTGEQRSQSSRQFSFAGSHFQLVGGDGLIGQVADLHNNGNAFVFRVGGVDGDNLTGQGNIFHNSCILVFLGIRQLVDFFNDLLRGLAGGGRSGNLAGSAVGDVAFSAI